MSTEPTTHDEAEIVIVGGGPSGSTAAAALAELGHDVLLIDKDQFPREKPCGDGLMHPAVAAAERLGLDNLIESSLEVEAARVVLSHRHQNLVPLASAPNKPRPRCVTRSDFDAALLGAAQERGARFRCARVDKLRDDDGDRRLLAIIDGEPKTVRAGMVIAADGATSRLRRELSASQTRPAAYAVRQYFISEKPLDPVFDFYFPLEIDGNVLSGYGWVFPIDQHTANIGVGFYRDDRGNAPLTRVLSAFVEELQTKAAHRFGDLEAKDEPFGSPFAIRSPKENPDVPGVIFAGDAAGTTHPITGEGISFAIRSGEAVARVAHARSRKGAGGSVVYDGNALWSSFPQLGVDISMLRRMSTLEVDRGASGSAGSTSKPFLGEVWRILGESAYETRAEGTPAWAVLEARDPALAERLERANDALLESLASPMPFVTEVIHRGIRSHLGPMYGAVALAIADARGAASSEEALEAAIAAETVAILPELLTMLVDRAHSKTLRVNNAFAILTADYAATRALAAASKLGASGAAALALASQRGCEGGMRDSAARFAADRTVESWFQAASETAGAAMFFAAQVGAMVGGESKEAAEALRSYTAELGTAIRLAEEIVDLTVGEDLHPGREGADLRRGIYPLPLLYAIEADSRLPRMLAQHTAESGNMAEIIDAVRESGGLERAVVECARRGEAAASLAREIPGSEGATLEALAAAPANYVAVRTGGGEAADALSAQAG